MYFSIVKEKSDEFVFKNKHIYLYLVDEMNKHMDSLNDNIMNLVLETALEVSGKAELVIANHYPTGESLDLIITLYMV